MTINLSKNKDQLIYDMEHKTLKVNGLDSVY